MQNGRDDKYEGSDDSEYHFTDDEANYDSDSSESAKPAGSVEPGTGGMIESASRSKRMLISLAVFLLLITVVYKMVSPSSSTPSTDIKPQAANTQMSAEAAQPAANQPAQQAAPAQQPAQTMPSAASQMMQPAEPQQAMQAPQSPPTTMQPPTAQQVMQPQQPPAGTQMMPAQSMPPQGMQPPPPTQVVSQQQGSVMPAMQPPAQADQSIVVDMQGTTMQKIDAAGNVLAATATEKADQQQAQYSQRIADEQMQAQNKAMQDQMQILNSRVAVLETQITQLVQTLTQQFQNAPASYAPPSVTTTTVGGTGATIPPAPLSMPEQVSPPPRIPYNVQAIIPGRAWLRSNSGDTLTVAEGDDIKGVGRVTKIDPYDGVVEINVRGKTISLSYGNGT